MRLQPGVDHQWPLATPVLVARERVNPVNIDGRVRARERHPQEVAQRFGDELAIVYDHNPPKSADKVGKTALSLGIDGTAKNWVPDLKEILFHTKIVQPGATEVIYFVAPSTEGDYEYVCTYPGHYMSMRGTMKVYK